MIRTQVRKHLQGAREDHRGGGKGDIKRGTTARSVMENGQSVGVILGKEVRRDYLIKRQKSFSKGSQVPFEFLWMVAIEVSQNEVFCRKERWGKGVGFAIHQRKANRRSINVKERERPYIVKQRSSKETKGGGRKFGGE